MLCGALVASTTIKTPEKPFIHVPRSFHFLNSKKLYVFQVSNNNTVIFVIDYRNNNYLYKTYMEGFTFLNSAEEKLLFVAKKFSTAKQPILRKLNYNFD